MGCSRRADWHGTGAALGTVFAKGGRRGRRGSGLWVEVRELLTSPEGHLRPKRLIPGAAQARSLAGPACAAPPALGERGRVCYCSPGTGPGLAGRQPCGYSVYSECRAKFVIMRH